MFRRFSNTLKIGAKDQVRLTPAPSCLTSQSPCLSPLPDATLRSDTRHDKQEEVVRIDVSGIKVSGVPRGLGGSSGRLLWTRDSKMQMTPLGAGTVGGNVVEWTPNSANGELSLIATFERVGEASFKKKEYDFKV